MKKNNLHKIAVLVTMIIGLCCHAGAQTQIVYVDNIEYLVRTDYNYASVHGYVSGHAPSGTLTIPSSVTYNGTAYPVTQIDASAFQNCLYLTGVVFPNTIVSIGTNAFRCTNLHQLTLPNSLQRIERYAFVGNSNLSGTLTLPNSLTEIGAYAFGGSHFTGSLTIPSSIQIINEGAFEGCSFNGTLTMSNSVWKIEAKAFRGCGFTSLVLSESLTEIGASAFYDMNIQGSLTIPNSVQTIGDCAFWGLSSADGKLTIGNSVIEIGSCAFYSCGFTEVESLAVTPPLLISSAFANVPCTTLTVPFACREAYSTGTLWNEHFTTFEENRNFTAGDYMYYATTTSNVTVMNHVNGAAASGNITIPSTVVWAGNAYPVKSIGENAFSSSSITVVILHAGINSVAANAFKSCQSLQNVMIINPTPPTLGNGAFTDIPCNTLKVPESSVSEYMNSTWHERFANIEGYTVTFDVGNYSYRVIDENSVMLTGCSAAAGNVNIPASVTYGGHDFNVTEIGDNAFYYGTGFTGTLTLPNTLTKIGKQAFRNCGFTCPLTLPSSLKFIDKYAFASCSGLTGQLNIPNSVEFIGFAAFENCTGFSGELPLPEGLTVISGHAFYGCTGLTGTLVLPNAITRIDNGAFRNCSFTGPLTIPNSVTSIGATAFTGCSGFTGALIIPNYVTTIGSGAFGNCTGFTSLTIGSAVNEIDYQAFYNLTGITGDVVVLASQPPTLVPDFYNPIATIFENMPSTTLRVPFGSRQAYTQSDWTVHFTTFIEDEYAVIGEYRYHGNSDNTLTIVEHLDGVAATGFKTIPGTITVNESTYTVNAIGEDVFKGSDISGVVIPSTITSIGANAISNCPNLINVEVKATTPPTLGNNTFNNIPCYSLNVPCGCTAAYEASPWANFFLYYYEDCVGVDDVAEEKTLSIYPNPSHGFVKIETENIKNVSIFNALGQQIFNSKASGDAFEYNFNGNTGMYLIRVETDKGIETKRVIVI